MDDDDETDGHAPMSDEELADTDRDRPVRGVQRTSELDESELAELSRLHARLGFISKAEAVPRRVGSRYDIVRTIGYGGMGVVYQVYDNELESDEVALKLVRSATFGDSARAQARLHHEAQQMVRLRDHAHIVTVLDVGRCGASTYLTMQYVDGTDLRVWRTREAPPTVKILEAYRDAARGLQAAHDRGVVHRDFKPDNVLIDAGGLVKVTDFGIASTCYALIEEGGGEGAGPAATEIRGTVPYMSPEQMAGERPDKRTDQFSFCVALWEALAGELPYTWRDGPTQAAALSTPPTGQDQIPRWLRPALLRGMSARRVDRYVEMSELIAIIERGLERPRRWRRAAWLLAVVLGLGTATGYALWDPPEPTCTHFVSSIDEHWSPARRAALLARGELAPSSIEYVVEKLDELEIQWKQAAGDQCVGDQAPSPMAPERRCLDAWIDSLSVAIDWLEASDDPADLLDGPDLLARLEPPGGDFCAISGAPIDPRLGRLIEGTRTALERGAPAQARDLSEEALALAHTQTEPGAQYSLPLAHAYTVHAEVLTGDRAFEEASAAYREAEAHAAGTNELRLLARVRIFWARAQSLQSTDGSGDYALDLLDRAEPLFAAAAMPEDALLRGDLEEARALAHEALGQDQEALASYNAAASFFSRAGNPILAARARSNRGVLNHERGRLEAADADYAAAIAAYARAQVPPDYRRLLDAQLNLGLVRLDRYYTEGDDEFAANALYALEPVLAHAAPELRLMTYGYACELAADSGRRSQLEALLRPALEEFQASTGIDPALRTTVQLQLGRALLEGLEDPRGEDLLRPLIERQQTLDTMEYWILMTAWIEHLERTGDCARAAELTRSLRSPEDLEQMTDWLAQRPGDACS